MFSQRHISLTVWTLIFYEAELLLFIVSWVIWVFRVYSHEYSCGAIREILSDVGMSLILVIHLTILSVDPIITIGLFCMFCGGEGPVFLTLNKKYYSGELFSHTMVYYSRICVYRLSNL